MSAAAVIMPARKQFRHQENTLEAGCFKEKMELRPGHDLGKELGQESEVGLVYSDPGDWWPKKLPGNSLG